MKRLTYACCICMLALSTAACTSLSAMDAQLRALDLGADTYVVRAGDTLETIAFRYRLSPEQLTSMNPGLDRRFAAGTHINVRQPRAQIAQYRSQPDKQRYAGIQATDGRDSVVTTPVYSPRAVAIEEKKQPVNRSTYTPAVNAVVSDLALLNAPATPSSGSTVRHGVMQPGNDYPYEEEVDSFGGRRLVDDSLQGYVGRWNWPTQGQVARGFSPVKEGRHGVDIAGLPGQPVVAVLDGTVVYSGRDPSGTGNLIIVRHENSLLTAYSHTQDLYVAEEDTVRAGDPIATLGWNAQEESVLRFEVRQDGNSLNPMDFLASR